MALNLGGGDFLPYVKFNSKADKWFVRGDKADLEIQRPTFVADFRSIKTGWFLLMEGQAPNIVWDPNLVTPASKPSDKHKRGFKLNLFSQSFFGNDGLVEFTGASMHVCAAINELYDAYEKELAANAGKLPVVAVVGSTPQKDKHGVNYKPIFAIQKWVDVPAIFDEASTPAPSNTNTVAPPAASIAQAAQVASTSEF